MTRRQESFLERRVAELEAEVARLREALAPFAVYCDALEEWHAPRQVPDDRAISLLNDGSAPTLGDLRRAREALTSTTPLSPQELGVLRLMRDAQAAIEEAE